MEDQRSYKYSSNGKQKILIWFVQMLLKNSKYPFLNVHNKFGSAKQLHGVFYEVIHLEDMCSQPDGTTSHFTKETGQLLKGKFVARCILRTGDVNWSQISCSTVEFFPHQLLKNG